MKLLIAIAILLSIGCTSVRVNYEPIPEDVWEAHQRP